MSVYAMFSDNHAIALSQRVYCESQHMQWVRKSQASHLYCKHNLINKEVELALIVQVDTSPVRSLLGSKQLKRNRKIISRDTMTVQSMDKCGQCPGYDSYAK